MILIGTLGRGVDVYPSSTPIIVFNCGKTLGQNTKPFPLHLFSRFDDGTHVERIVDGQVTFGSGIFEPKTFLEVCIRNRL